MACVARIVLPIWPSYGEKWQSDIDEYRTGWHVKKLFFAVDRIPAGFAFRVQVGDVYVEPKPVAWWPGEPLEVMRRRFRPDDVRDT